MEMFARTGIHPWPFKRTARPVRMMESSAGLDHEPHVKQVRPLPAEKPEPPLALGLAKLTRLRAMRVPRDVANTRFRDVSVLLSDGRTAERPPVPVGFDRVIVADFESHRIALNRCAEIATRWGAEWDSVRIEVDASPTDLNQCHCSICRRYGVLWAYYDREQVRLLSDAQATRFYCWGDRDIEFHRCRACGCVTHWTDTDGNTSRMAINARLFDPKVIAGVPIRQSNEPSS